MINSNDVSLFGYAPSVLNGTEKVVHVPEHINTQLPSAYDLRHELSPIEDQKQNPYCLPFSLSATLNYHINLIKRTHGINYDIDERVIYDQRLDKNMSGMRPKTAFHWLKHTGMKIPKVSEAYKIHSYALCNSIDSIKFAIVSNGLVISGLRVQDSTRNDFWNGAGFEGGHAICFVGYDDEKQHLILRNSWGKDYGDNGYWYFPYGMLKDKAFESWVIIPDYFKTHIKV